MQELHTLVLEMRDANVLLKYLLQLVLCKKNERRERQKQYLKRYDMWLFHRPLLNLFSLQTQWER